MASLPTLSDGIALTHFIVAEDGARASDVWSLILLVRERVREHSGADLQPEVRLVGRFGDG